MKKLAVMSASLMQQRLCRALARQRILRGHLEAAWRALLVLLQSYRPGDEDPLQLLLHCSQTQRVEDLILDAFRRKDQNEQRVLLQIGRMLVRGRTETATQLVE